MTTKDKFDDWNNLKQNIDFSENERKIPKQ
jgi:hypothetical protein